MTYSIGTQFELQRFLVQSFFRLFIGSLFLSFTTLVFAETIITVTHPEVPAPTLLDHGAKGQSIGDVRLWHFKAKTGNNSEVMTDWIMTTTSVSQETSSMESRITSAVFSFSPGLKDQIIIQGVASYPSLKATLVESSPTARGITGGTGKFAGVGGWVETTHLTDGSWQHILHIM